jgi:hypothetical protein
VGTTFGVSYFCFELFFFPAPASFYFLCSWWGCLPVEAESQPL